MSATEWTEPPVLEAAALPGHAFSAAPGHDACSYQTTMGGTPCGQPVDHAVHVASVEDEEIPLDEAEGAEAARVTTVDGQEAMIDGTVPPVLVERPKATVAQALQQLYGAEERARETGGTLSKAKAADKLANDAVAAAYAELREAAEREVRPELEFAGEDDR